MKIREITFVVDELGGFTVQGFKYGTVSFDNGDEYWSCDTIEQFLEMGHERFASSLLQETGIDLDLARDIWTNVIMFYGFLTR